MRDSLGIPGDHDDLDTAGMQRVDRLTRLLAHLIGEPNRADHGTVGDHVQDDRAVGLPRLGRLEHAEPLLVEKVRSAHRYPSSGDRSRHADGRRRAEFGSLREVEPPRSRRCHDRPGQRVLAILFR